MLDRCLNTCEFIFSTKLIIDWQLQELYVNQTINFVDKHPISRQTFREILLAALVQILHHGIYICHQMRRRAAHSTIFCCIMHSEQRLSGCGGGSHGARAAQEDTRTWTRPLHISPIPPQTLALATPTHTPRIYLA